MSCQAINVEIEYVFKGFDSIHDVRRNQLVAMTIDVLLGDGPHGSLSLSTSLNCVVKEAGGDSDGGESEMDTKQQHKSPWSRCFLFSNTFQSFNLVLFRVFFFQMTQSGIFSQK